MRNIDDELEEVKRLIGSDITKAPLPREESATAPAGQGKPNAPQTPGMRQSRPGSPEAQQKPGSDKSVSGLPAVRQAPGVPQPRQAPGAPKASQTRQPPTQPRGFTSPGFGERRDDARPYDIPTHGDAPMGAEDEPELDVGSKKFKVKFDFESAYKDVPEERPLRRRREKRTGCVGGILYGAFVISISLVLATLIWMAAVDVLGFGGDDEQINITVHPDFTIDGITDMLYDAGLIQYKFLFSIYASFSSAEKKITAGSYVLNRSFDYRALVQGMTARAGVRVETTVTIPEGFTLAQMFTLFEDYGVCTANELWDAAENHNFSSVFLDEETLGDRLRLEGFLFPDTYDFYLNSTPVQVIARLLREFERRFTEEYIKRAEDMGYSVREIIIIASMIEREAGSEEERPRIAAVIYNRLKSRDFPLLQIDATIRYAIAGTGRPFSTDIDHPYNTYLHEGLPPGPIASPSMASIRAALYPDSTKEYFYALNKEGTHNFFRTRAQHEAFVNSAEYGGR